MERDERYHRFNLVRFLAPLVVLFVALDLLAGMSNKAQTIVVAAVVLVVCGWFGTR